MLFPSCAGYVAYDRLHYRDKLRMSMSTARRPSLCCNEGYRVQLMSKIPTFVFGAMFE